MDKENAWVFCWQSTRKTKDLFCKSWNTNCAANWPRNSTKEISIGIEKQDRVETRKSQVTIYKNRIIEIKELKFREIVKQNVEIHGLEKIWSEDWQKKW